MTRFPYRAGDCLAICDRCGCRFYLSELSEQYDGLMVCNTGCFDEQHPQELAPPPRVQQPIMNTRPEPADNFIEEMSVSRDDL